MDALRWTILIVGILVMAGFYAWSKRAQLLAWWHGQRDNDDFRFEEAGDDLSDELRRLRDLMESEQDERPARRGHRDRDIDQLDADYGIEVSAPRVVRRPVEETRQDAERAGDDDGSRDVLMEAAAAKVSGKHRNADVPVSAPRVSTAPPRPLPPKAPRKPVMVEVPSPSTEPGRPPARPDFSIGADSVSAPRVRKAAEAKPESVPEPPPVEQTPVMEVSPVIAPFGAAAGPAPADPGIVDLGVADPGAPTVAHVDDEAVQMADPVAEPAREPEPESEPEADVRSGLMPDLEPNPEREPEPEPVREAVLKPESASMPEPARVPEPQPQPDPRPPIVAGSSATAPSGEAPRQTALDLGDDAPSMSPPARRRLDTVIVDGEVFDTDRGPVAQPSAPEAKHDAGHFVERVGPGLTEIGGHVATWFKGLAGKAREHMPRKPEPPVQSTPELILVVHVMAGQGSHFTGDEIRAALRAHKLGLGENGLYEVLPKHRATTAPVVCVANMLEPGVLTDDELVDMQTPGLTLFLRLPGPVEGTEALEVLLTTAQAISRELQGEMRDQARNRLTKQTINHMHEQVLEHARRMQIALSRKR
ncbi:MAG: cell division protein ZipA C-terminal FtsZ-binding domain-containing protein [Chromatiales bacterium]|nr:cell division protein ZipA C-terminal FtsZ-binding domain-containing protein [Chromatiales bacterium]